MADEEIGCLAVEQYGGPANTLNGDGAEGWRHGGGNGLQIDLKIGDLAAGDGDGPSCRRVAVVDHLHLVVARTQLQLAMMTGFAHRAAIYEDVGLLRSGLNG